MKFPIERIRALSSHLTIPSRELGRIKLTKLYGTAEYVLQEVTRGFEDGIHDFTILKGGRQIAGTTTADVISLFWPLLWPLFRARKTRFFNMLMRSTENIGLRNNNG